MAFFHIGKTAGATLSGMLRHGCNAKPCQRRVEKWGIPNETEISKQTYKTIHCLFRPDHHADMYTSALVSLRDPVTRFLSWFVFVHPSNRKYMAYRGTPILDAFLDECVDNADDFALSLVTKNHTNTLISSQYFSVEDTNYSCVTYGQDVVSAERPWKEINHAFWNIRHYVSQEGWLFENYHKSLPKHSPTHSYYQKYVNTWPVASKKEVFVVRQDKFWEDWQAVNTLLGGGNVIQTTKIVSHIKMNGDLPVSNRTLSARGALNLCCFLWDDILAFRAVLYRAENIKLQDKDASMEAALTRCGVLNIGDLASRCDGLFT